MEKQIYSTNNIHQYLLIFIHLFNNFSPDHGFNYSAHLAAAAAAVASLVEAAAAAAHGGSVNDFPHE